MLAPLGPVYQAGTLSGNPLAMAAGIATLTEILARGESLYTQLDDTTAAIAGGVALIAAELGIGMTTNRVGSMFTWFFTPEDVMDFAMASRVEHGGVCEVSSRDAGRGVWLPPSQFEAAFVSAAHGQTEADAILAAASWGAARGGEVDLLHPARADDEPVVMDGAPGWVSRRKFAKFALRAWL